MSDRVDCANTRELLDAFHDAELDSAQREKVEHHLSACEQCRKALTDIELVVSSLRSLPQLTPARDFAANIDAMLEQKRKPGVLKRPALWGSLGVAAAIAFLMLALKHPANAPAPVDVATDTSTATSAPSVAGRAPTTSAGSVAAIRPGGSAPGKGQPMRKEAQGSPGQRTIKYVKPKIYIADQGTNGQSATAGGANLAAPNAVRAQQPPAIASQRINQQAPPAAPPARGSGAQQIAQAGQHTNIDHEVIALYDNDTSTAEELGISTDEDGLYALKL